MAPAADSAQDGAQTQYAPNPRIQYAEPAYWDQRYKAQPLSFDWFYGWQALRKLIRTHLPRRKAVIQIGCGNSNLQEGMARNGYHVVNVDISQVVIDQMREQHASIPNCTYVLGDCRDLSMFGNCHFYGAIEKGTIDALVCSPDSAVNIHRMCMELLRVLQPGATFMAISLGEPSQRLPLLCRPEYGWTVSLCLIPRVGADAMVPAPGRPIPLNDTVKPIHHLGPFRVAKDLSIEGLPTTYEPAGYFYAYLCRKAPLMLRTDSKGKGTLPQMRTSTVRETMEQLQQQLGLSKDVLTRGRRKNLVNKKEFLASQPADQQPISRQGSTHSSSRGREPAGAAAAAAAGPHAPPITAGVAADATPFHRHSLCGVGSLTLTHPPQPSSLTQQPGSSRSSSSSPCPHGRPQDQHSPSEGEAQGGGAKQAYPGMMGGCDGSSVLPKLADLEEAAAAGGEAGAAAGAAAREAAAAAAAAAAPPVSAESPFLLHSTSRLAKLPQPSSNQLAQQQQQPGPHQAQPAAPLSLQGGDADDRSVAGQAQRSLPPAYSYLAGSRAASTCASLASEDGEGDLEGQGGEADPTYSRPSLDLVRLHDLQCVDPVSTRAVEGGQPALQSTLPQLQQQQQEQQQGQQEQQQQGQQLEQGQQEQQHQQLRLQG